MLEHESFLLDQKAIEWERQIVLKIHESTSYLPSEIVSRYMSLYFLLSIMLLHIRNTMKHLIHMVVVLIYINYPNRPLFSILPQISRDRGNNFDKIFQNIHDKRINFFQFFIMQIPNITMMEGWYFLSCQISRSQW